MRAIKILEHTNSQMYRDEFGPSANIVPGLTIKRKPSPELSLLKSKEIQTLIDNVHTPELERDATFGIFNYCNGPEESFIRANKQGLLLFAAELLKAARDCGEITGDTKKTIAIKPGEDLIDGKSSTFIHYVQIVNEREAEESEPENKESFAAKLVSAGLTLGVITIFISLFAGFLVLAKWIL